MEVILKEDVLKLGHRGDVVKVADGYGRNYLLPGKLAIEATTRQQGSDRADEGLGRAQDRQGEDPESEELAQARSPMLELNFERKVGENDHLFGSVTSGDIAHADGAAKGYVIDRRKIALEEPLKQLGEFHVPVKLHREVTAHVKVTIKSDAPDEVAAPAA